VPLIIKGPGVKADTDSNVMVNGLDFYPTILSLAGASKETGQKFDGCNLSTLLHKDPTDSNLVRDAGGNIRDTLMWHFPSSVWMESSIRVGDYKLMRNYDHRGGPNSRWRGTLAPPLELYRLYNTESGEAVRVDIEEQNNLVESMPEKARELDQRLTEMLTEMNATYPAFNPHSATKLPHKAKVPTVVSHKRDGQKVEFTYKKKGASVKSAHLIYTTEGDYLRAEWLKHPAQLQPEHKITATLPPGTTHYFLYLLDENNFLLNYPELPNVVKGEKLNYSDTALKVK